MHLFLSYLLVILKKANLSYLICFFFKILSSISFFPLNFGLSYLYLIFENFKTKYLYLHAPLLKNLLKNLTTISGLNALNSDQTRSGVPKPEKFVSYRNTKRSGLYRRQIKDATWARIEPSTYDLPAQLANHYTN